MGGGCTEVWRKLMAQSEYAALLPRLGTRLAALLASDPHAAYARLTSRGCAYCPAAGEYFFTLHACRVCRDCFQLDVQAPGEAQQPVPNTTLAAFLRTPRPPLCALMTRNMAKHLFLLSDGVVNALPSLVISGADATRIGASFSSASSATLVTAGDCLRASLARFGTPAALVAAAAARRATMLAAHETKRESAADAKTRERIKAPPDAKDKINLVHLNQVSVQQQHSARHTAAAACSNKHAAARARH